ncbi:tetratricopeptide repeat protein [candidate division FCPU426 bacterium]|nr:tetratricopeptide repeat protein [candidate division FCPU426 bacterium]
MSRNLYWGTAFFLAVLLLVPPFYLGPAVSLLVLGTLLLGLLAWMTMVFDQERLAQMPFGPPLLLLLAVQTLAVIFSHDPAYSLNPFSRELSFLLVFLLAAMLARHIRSVRPMLVLFFTLGVLLAVYGIYQHAAGLVQSYQDIYAAQQPNGSLEQAVADRLLSRRAFSLFTYPNLLAGFLALLLPLGFSLLTTTTRRWAAWAYGLGIVLMVTGVYASGSLGGWICAMAGLACYFYLRRVFAVPSSAARAMPLRVWLAGGLLALLGAATIFISRGPYAFWSDATARACNWASALRIGWDHFITGVGPGMFGVVFPDYQLTQGYYVRFGHNFFLHAFAETGFLGAGAWVWLLAAIGRQVIGWMRDCKNEKQKHLVAGLLAGTGAMLLHALMDVDLNFMKTGIGFWFLLGTCVGLSACRRGAPQQLSAPFEQVVRWGLGAVGILVLWKGGKSLLVEGVLYGAVSLLALIFLIGKIDSLSSWYQLLKRVPLRWPLATLLVWGVLSALVSLHPAGAISGIILGVVGLMVYSITVQAHRPGQLLARVLLLGTSGMAVAALIQAGFRPDMRVTAGWPNANLLAAFLAMGFLSCLALFVLSRNRLKERMLYALGSLVNFFALLATGSLAGVANVTAGSVLLLVWVKRRQSAYFTFSLLALLLMVALVFMLPFQTGRRLSDLRHYGGQLYERWQLSTSALQMTANRPLAGYGPGNFSRAFERFNFPNIRGLSRFGMQAQFAHNEFLQTMAETGIPGGLFLLWLIWGVLAHLRRQLRNPATEEDVNEDEHLIRAAAWCALTGAAVQALFDFNWHPPALFLWYMMLLGVAVAPSVRGRAEGEKSVLDLSAWRKRVWEMSRQPVVIVLVVLLLAATTAATRPLLSQYLEQLGIAHRYKQDLKAADREFQRALAVHPFSAQTYDQLGQIRIDFYAMMGSENWFQLSEWAFRKALALDGLDAFIHRHLGSLYALKAVRLPEDQKQQQYNMAEREYLLALEKSPRKALLYFELGNVLRDAGRMDAAEKAWMQAVELEPNYAAALSNLGVVQEMRGDFDGAESSYRKALKTKEIAPGARSKYEMELLVLNWAVVHYNLGNLMERQGRWQEARTEYKEALDLEPDNSIVQKRLRNLDKIMP